MMNFYLYLKHFPVAGGPLRVGTCKAVHGLASGLAACGAQVSLLCEGDKRITRRAPAGYDIECFRNTGPYRSFRVSSQLEEYFSERANQTSLAILNGIFHPAVFGVAGRLRHYDIPYVIAPHGSYDPSLFRRNAHLKWPYWYACERPVLRNALAIQVLDGRQNEWTIKRGVFTPSVEVPNGFAVEDVFPESSLNWSNQGKVRLLFWGRMHIQQKGLDLLLDAVSALAPQLPLELTLQGPDWHGEKQLLMRRIARLNLNDTAHFVDPDFETPPTRVMGNHDILCMPSRYEGFGLSALEGMLAARPLLVTKPSGIARHVQASNCGVVVEPATEAIEQGLLELVERRSEWRDMGQRGREYALQNLNWRAIAHKAITNYAALVN